jgi:hypothetical protein
MQCRISARGESAWGLTRSPRIGQVFLLRFKACFPLVFVPGPKGPFGPEKPFGPERPFGPRKAFSQRKAGFETNEKTSPKERCAFRKSDGEPAKVSHRSAAATRGADHQCRARRAHALAHAQRIEHAAATRAIQAAQVRPRQTRSTLQPPAQQQKICTSAMRNRPGTAVPECARATRWPSKVGERMPSKLSQNGVAGPHTAEGQGVCWGAKPPKEQDELKNVTGFSEALLNI